MLHRASVGDMRAARKAGQSPATAPIRMAAPMPPPQARAGITTSSCLLVGVDGRGERTRPDADGAADEGEEYGLGEELGPDVASGGAEGSAQPDLGPAFEHGDDHDVGHPDRADQQGNGAETQEEVVEGALASAWATRAAEGWETSTSLGFSGLAVAASKLSTWSTWLVWART